MQGNTRIIDKKPNNLDSLVSAAACGDQKAYEMLFNEFFPKISRFVALRVENRPVAEDLTADIFVKVWETLQEKQEVSSFYNWIFTIARNKIIDHWRTKKTYSDIFELENLLEYEDNVVEAIDLTIASKKFLQVLDQLSADQQQVIRLKFLENLDNAEIAAIMDKTPGTIRVIQHRAICELKNLLGNQQ